MCVVGGYMWRGLRLSREGSEERAVMAGLLAAYIAILLGNLLYHYYLNGFVWFLMGCGVALSYKIMLEAQANRANKKPPDVVAISEQIGM